MDSVFIAYAHENKAFALHLANTLSQLGVNIWMDVKSIPGGEQWAKAIQKALDNARIMLLIMSPAAMSSDYVHAEWMYFLTKKKVIIPILLEATEIHFQLLPLQYIDFVTEQFEDVFKQLIDALTVKGIQIESSPDTDKIAPIHALTPALKTDETRHIEPYQQHQILSSITRKTGALDPNKVLEYEQRMQHFDEETILQLNFNGYAKAVQLKVPVGKKITVGRSEKSKVVCPDIDLEEYDASDHGVSRTHAFFWLERNRLYISDMDSRNSTAVNTDILPPNEKHPLKDGDKLTFGLLAATVRFIRPKNYA